MACENGGVALTPECLLAAAEFLGDAIAIIADATPDGRWQVVGASSEFRSYLGGRPDLLGRVTADQTVADMLFEALAAGRAASCELTLADSGPLVPVQLSPLRDGLWSLRLGIAGGFQQVLRDLSGQTQRSVMLADEVPVGLLYCANGARVQWSNQKAARLLGLEKVDVAGLGWQHRFDEVTRSAIADASMDLLDGVDVAPVTASFPLDSGMRHLSLRFAAVAAESGGGFVVTLEDVTAQVEVTGRLLVEATTDSLTGLANRSSLRTRVEAMIAATSPAQQVAVLFLDLDGFKAVNDAHGHDAGDELLREVARRLSAVVRPGDVVARLGGDEFVVALSNIADLSGVRAVAGRVLSSVSQPVRFGEVGLSVTPSVGVALTGVGGCVDEALRRADGAMYAAKRSGKARFVFADDL